jgi:hypothetical protein
VERGEALGRDVAHLEEMMQIGRRVVAAERTVAAHFDGTMLDAVLRIVDAHGAEEVVAR